MSNGSARRPEAKTLVIALITVVIFPGVSGLLSYVFSQLGGSCDNRGLAVLLPAAFSAVLFGFVAKALLVAKSWRLYALLVSSILALLASVLAELLWYSTTNCPS